MVRGKEKASKQSHHTSVTTQETENGMQEAEEKQVQPLGGLFWVGVCRRDPETNPIPDLNMLFFTPYPRPKPGNLYPIPDLNPKIYTLFQT